MNNIGAIIQARFSSTRLPGKILKKLPRGSDVTALEQVIRRLKRSKRLDDIIIATTNEKKASGIVKIAKKEGVKYFRGDTKNVLSRYYLAARKNSLDIVVRITSDCPCIDPEIVDMTIKRHMDEDADYTSNSLKISYPRGLDVEVFGFDALERAYRNADKGYEKEHVTPYMYKNPKIFKIVNIKAPKTLYAPGIRITLDTQKDYELLCAVFDSLYFKNKFFSAYDIIKLFKEKPWLKLINQNVVQKSIPV